MLLKSINQSIKNKMKEILVKKLTIVDNAPSTDNKNSK